MTTNLTGFHGIYELDAHERKDRAQRLDALQSRLHYWQCEVEREPHHAMNVEQLDAARRALARFERESA